MRIPMKHLLLLSLALVFAPVARAQQAAPKEGVWKYVDAATVVVARIDLSAYDRGTLEQWLGGIVKANVKDARTADAVARGIHDGPVLAYPEQLKEAGAKEAYAVVSLGDIPNATGWLVVPVPAGADAGKIQRACFPAGSKPEPEAGAHSGPLVLRAGSLFATAMQDVVILSTGRSGRFLPFAAADRPDLVAALSAAGNGPLVAAFSPNEDTRKVVEQMMPQLPPPASAPSTVLTRGLRYASLSMDFPPQQKLDFVIQASDAQAAGALHDLIVRLLDMPRKDKGFRSHFPAADQVFDALTPKVAGDRLVVSMDSAGVDRVAGLLATGLVQAHAVSARVKSMSNLRQIGMGIQLYRNEHHGAPPENLRQTEKYYGDNAADSARLFAQVNVNPVDPERKDPYTYVKPAVDLKATAPDTLIVYESFDQWPGQIGVLFADGHVEGIGDQKRFEELLAKAKGGK